MVLLWDLGLLLYSFALLWCPAAIILTGVYFGPSFVRNSLTIRTMCDFCVLQVLMHVC